MPALALVQPILAHAVRHASGATLLLSFAITVVGFALCLVGFRGAQAALPALRQALRVTRARERTAASLRAASEPEGPQLARLDEGEDAGRRPVALRGVAALVEEGAPIDPLGRRPCVAFRLVVDRQPPARRIWEALVDDTEVRPFVLRDPTGVARVMPGEAPHIRFRGTAQANKAVGVADVRLVEVLQHYGIDREIVGASVRARTQHAAIEVGAQVVAIGRVQSGPHGAGPATIAGDIEEPLILAELPAGRSLRGLAFDLLRPLLVAAVQILAGALCVAQLAVVLFAGG